jgi:tyrosinase
MANDIRMRQGVHNLTIAGVADFRNAYQKMMSISDNRGFAWFAGLHGTPNFWCWHHQKSPHFRNQVMELFLPWHRAYLYNFEMAMRDQVPGVTLPWWDWTLRPPRQNGIPDIFAAPQVNGQHNPLFSFQMNVPTASPPLHRATARDPGPPDELPTQELVDEVLIGNLDFSGFTDALEGQLHDAVHGWVSGDMGIVAVAAYDPIFWSHHAMVDRLWWLWQVRNGNGNMPPDMLDVVLAPFRFKVRDVLNINALGYDYAASQTVIPIGGHP